MLNLSTDSHVVHTPYMVNLRLPFLLLLRYNADGTSDSADLGDLLYHLLGVPPRCVNRLFRGVNR